MQFLRKKLTVYYSFKQVIHSIRVSEAFDK